MKTAAKKVKTFDSEGVHNGHLIELGKDGRRTTTYLTTVLPGCFKGFHAHLVREANYTCIRGCVDVILFFRNGHITYSLSADNPEHLHIPLKVPTGLSNTSDEEAWIVNVPIPAYDPLLLDEQVDLDTEEEAAEWALFHG